MVTAGFKCAPLNSPVIYAATNTAKPQAVVIVINGVSFDPLVLLRLTLATIPEPRSRRIVVPTNSAI